MGTPPIIASSNNFTLLIHNVIYRYTVLSMSIEVSVAVHKINIKIISYTMLIIDFLAIGVALQGMACSTEPNMKSVL